jgi:hypothetical protein
MLRTRLALAILLAVAAPATPLAQESAGYRLEEHVLNSGGRPLQGQVATSASYRLTLDSLGQALGGPGTAEGAGFRVTVGLPAAFRPAGEVEDLRFTSAQTMTWTPDPAIGDYVLYRGPAAGSPPALWGGCTQAGLIQPSTTDTDVPAVGTGFLYLVGARDRLRAPGPLGTTSAGATRTPSALCP